MNNRGSWTTYSYEKKKKQEEKHSSFSYRNSAREFGNNSDADCALQTKMNVSKGVMYLRNSTVEFKHNTCAREKTQFSRHDATGGILKLGQELTYFYDSCCSFRLNEAWHVYEADVICTINYRTLIK